MKNFCTVITLSLWLLSGPLSAQTKRALIVAIGDYPEASGWETINSANDVPLLKDALAYQGFTQVTVLQDEKADKAGVLRAIRALIDRSGKGDKVVIHFSSHGQQITDDSNDEMDAYDEAIVCYGAPARLTAKPGYDGSQHLRDDELSVLIEQLRAKLGAGGDVLVIADACHSGTISRGGVAKIRGRAAPLDLRRNKTNRLPNPPQFQPFLYDPGPAAPNPTVSPADLAPYVIISAAKASEVNSEYTLPDGTGIGSLSYAVNKTLRTVRPGETYRLLFNRIVAEMKQVVPNQTPELDGDYDRELFGGKAVLQAPFYPIQALKAGGRQLIIPAGKLEMVNPNTQVRVCPAGTTDPGRASSFVSGTVVQADLFSATIQLSQPVKASQNPAPWVFITERSYGDLSLTVSLDSVAYGPARSAIQTAFGKLPLIRIKSLKEAELYLTGTASPGGMNISVHKATDGFLIGKPMLVQQPADAGTVSDRVQNYAQGTFLQAFNPLYPGIEVTMELLPNRPGGKNAMDTLSRRTVLQNGLPAFVPGDKATLRVTNTGAMTVYFNVIDIQPDGIVNVVFPTRETPTNRDSPDNYVIAPGKSVLIPRRVEFSPPFGTETFKLLASPETFDLRNVIGLRTSGRGEAIRGLKNGMEKLFGQSQLMLRGGEAEATIPETTIGTFSYQFLIVPNRR